VRRVSISVAVPAVAGACLAAFCLAFTYGLVSYFGVLGFFLGCVGSLLVLTVTPIPRGDCCCPCHKILAKKPVKPAPPGPPPGPPRSA
jgi:hypothetical protein